MDVLHIVGGSGDQRFGRESSEVRDSELIDPLIHFLPDIGDTVCSGRTGDKSDNDLDGRHHNSAYHHIQTIPPDFGYTVFSAVLHSTGE